MLRKHFEMKNKDEYGFTLIELLVVIIIIGILAAIAIPAFLNQRQRANDSAVTSDVRNVAMQIETALVQSPNAASVDVATSGTPAVATITITGVTPNTVVNLTDGVVVTGSGSANGYILLGGHSNGKQYKTSSATAVADAPNRLTYNSANGGLGR